MKGACLHAGGAPAEAAAEQQHRRACRGAPVAGAPAGSRLQGPGGGRHLQVPLPTLRSTPKKWLPIPAPALPGLLYIAVASQSTGEDSCQSSVSTRSVLTVGWPAGASLWGSC